ncbi:MAG: hypothetical protein HY924_13965 [Elusimicrobia bacterium]|nr:hypothetical protein [Elusimicrobiota bacterium]
MTLLSRVLAVCLVLTGSAWSQSARTAPIRVKAIPSAVQAAALSPLAGGTFQTGLTPSIAAPSLGLTPLSASPLSLPAPEFQLQASAPAVPAMAEVPVEVKSPERVEAKVRQLTEAMAEPMALAADLKSTPDQSRKAGQDIEKAMTGAAQVQAQDDLPPAGPAAPLTQAQVSWLYGELVTGPRPLLTAPGFHAFILGHPAATARIVPWLRNERQAMALALSSLVGCLRRVAESGLPPVERSRLSQALNDQLSVTVRALSQNPGLKPMQRRVLAEVDRRFLSSRAALFEVTHYLQTIRTLRKLHGKVESLLAPSPAQSRTAPSGETGQAQQKPEHPWQIKPAPPKDQRGKSRDGEVSLVNKTADWAATVKQWQFLVEKHLSRYQIAMRGTLSRRAMEFTAQQLISLLEDYKRKSGVLFSGIERVTSYSLVNTFINPDSIAGSSHGIVWVPDNKNLRLVPEKGGYAVKASFETDIQDDNVLRSVKASIEEYWQGSFEFRGETHAFRTEVTITKLAPGAAFSQGALTIRDNAKWLSMAGPDVILLSRDLHYATAAHEFGHTMGLADEYRNGYDPERRASVEIQNPASIMSSLSGDVLPRHLKLAFLLLKRRSLAP